MGNITGFSIQNVRFVLVTVLLFVVAGILVYLNYPSREDPSITIRQVQITTVAPGMSPYKVEQLITKPIEKKLREIAEVDTITSDSKTGVSLIKAEVYDEIKQFESIWQDVRDKMDEVVAELPANVGKPIVNDEVGLTAIASIALWADGFSLAELKQFAEDIRDEIYTVDGTKKVELYGIQDEQIFIEFPQDLIQKGLQVPSIVDALVAQNVVMSGGELNVDGRLITLQPSGNFESLDDIRNLQVSIPETEDVIRLTDIATVRRAYVDPPSRPVLYNGIPALVLSVSINEGINSIHYGEQLRQKTQQLQNGLPWGVVIDYATYQPDLVKKSVNGAVNNLYQTLIIVLVVVMIFMGLRTGLIVGAFVPVTMLMSIVIMRWMDVELQRMSIAAMIIALGMLVDNGIVIAESINVKLRNGIKGIDAAIDTGKQLTIPLLTSTLTTILFFMPIAFAAGAAGEFTMSLAQVISIVLLSSWFLSLYLTPMVSSKFMKVTVQPNKPSTLTMYYTRFIEKVLRFKAVFFIGLIIVFVGSLSLMSKLDKEFFPLGERNQFLVYIDLPAGSSVYQTKQVTERLTHWFSDIETNPEVSSTVSYISGGGPRFFLSLSPPDPDEHKAFTLINTYKPEQVDQVLQRTKDYVLTAFPEARIEAKKMWMGGTETGLFELRLIDKNMERLMATSDRVVATLSELPDMAIVKQDWENPSVKLDLKIDQAQARQLGISTEQVASTLNGYFSGEKVSEFRDGDEIIPIVIRSEKGSYHQLSELLDVQIFSSTHATWVPLIELVDMEGDWQASRIKRRDQQRTLTVMAKHETKPAGYVLEQLQPMLEELEQQNITYELGGEVEGQAEANQKLFANFPYAFGLICLLLVWQFNSLRKTAIILLTIPLVTIGASVGLYVMNAPFGFMVILGFFSLAGIIINNGIVLIDQIKIEEAKLPPYQALITACQSRLRPILITTLTTVLGLLPLILSFDALFYGMASAIAFGLAVGSLLTLFFVPALYAVFYRIKVS